MTILVDTNVLLDVLARREPFYAAAAQIWGLAERGEVRAFVSAISFNNIYYIVRKLEGTEKAVHALRMLRDVFTPVPPDQQIINQAIDSEYTDFEDAVQFFSASRVSADFLVTRDPAHFKTGETSIPILTPASFLTAWEQHSAAANDK